jgi:hypothetical protein
MAKNRYADKFMSEQMYRVDAKGKFIEFIAPTEDFPMIKVTIQYNGQDNKKKSSADYYFRIPWFLEFCRKVSSNSLYTKAERLRASGNGNTSPFITEFGGNEKSRVARQFKISPAKLKDNVLFQIDSGEAKKGTIGEINYNNKEKFSSHFIPVSYQNLYEMAEICKLRVQAFVFRMEMQGKFISEFAKNRQAEQGAYEDFTSVPQEEIQQAQQMQAVQVQPTQAVQPQLVQAQPVQDDYVEITTPNGVVKVLRSQIVTAPVNTQTGTQGSGTQPSEVINVQTPTPVSNMGMPFEENVNYNNIDELGTVPFNNFA